MCVCVGGGGGEEGEVRGGGGGNGVGGGGGVYDHRHEASHQENLILCARSGDYDIYCTGKLPDELYSQF